MIPGARRHKILWIAPFRWALRFAAMGVLFVSGAFAHLFSLLQDNNRVDRVAAFFGQPEQQAPAQSF